MDYDVKATVYNCVHVTRLNYRFPVQSNESVCQFSCGQNKRSIKMSFMACFNADSLNVVGTCIKNLKGAFTR